MIDISADDMYWQVGPGKLAIQAVPDFAADRIIPITVKASAAGDAEININDLDNIGDETNIYLHDSETGLYHDLKSSPFTVALTPGEYIHRFTLRFSANALGVGNHQSNGFAVAYAQNVLQIHNNTADQIHSVALYNLAGQAVAQWDVEDQDQRNIQIKIYGLAQAAYIVKIVSDRATESTKIIVE